MEENLGNTKPWMDFSSLWRLKKLQEIHQDRLSEVRDSNVGL